MEYVSELYRKIANPPERRLVTSLCCWTDLLGFGNQFYQSEWNPSEQQWTAIHKRISEAHACCYSLLDPAMEFVLALNDGIVRCCDSDRIYHLDLLSFWLRACIRTHNRINESEHDKNLPGARTIFAAGPKLVHSSPEIRFDDFVFTYTKKQPAKISKIAKQLGNPAVALNPMALQLNLAFSRAYLLDSFGSKKGLQGPAFYVDQSVIDCSIDIARKLGRAEDIIQTDDSNGKLFAVSKKGPRYYYGFLFDRHPVEIKDEKLTTRVWRLLAFFPCDEDLPFKIDLI